MNSRGFTLVEIIVVVSILTLLALLAIPGIAQYRRDAKRGYEVFEVIDKAGYITKLCDRDTGNLMYVYSNGRQGGMAVVENGCQTAVDY